MIATNCYCVVDTAGFAYLGTARRQRQQSIREFVRHWTGEELQKWPYWRKRGYTVQRVTITPGWAEKEGKK